MRFLWLPVACGLCLFATVRVNGQERGFRTDLSQDSAKHGHHYVVAIGIDHYQNWPVLTAAESDAAGFAELLTKQFGFEFAADPLPETSATRDHINSLLDDELRRKLKPEDDLVFFFAGHGTTRKDKIGDRSESVGFLVPVDAHAPGSDERWSDYINVDELLRKISTLPSEHILVVLDSCHSGIALGGKFTSTRSDTRFEQDMLRKVSRKVITSAEADQTAADNGPLAGHSLFTGLMMQGLMNGKADSFGQGFITSTQLGAYAQHEVGVQEGSKQTPLFGSFDLDDGGELIIPLGTGTAESSTNKRELNGLESNEVARIRADESRYWDSSAGKNFPAARSAALKLCDDGDAWGCWQAAQSLRLGLGGDKDFSRAVSMARRGCEQKSSDACWELGLLEEAGDTTPPDVQGAIRIYKATCAQGNTRACITLGLHYENGDGVEQDRDKAEGLLKLACDSGRLFGCVALAWHFDSSRDFDRSVPMHKRLCGLGETESCMSLGWRYQRGEGVKTDFATSAESFRKACDGVELDGCGELAKLLRGGNGVPKDLKAAFSLAQMDCAAGPNKAAGCVVLGEMYENGETIEPNIEKAVESYTKGCIDAGRRDGCWELGRMYQSGKGVPKDLIEAAGLYRKACEWDEEQGWGKQGCTALGVLYETGEGLSKDVEMARSLYDRACKDPYSDPAACARLKALPPKPGSH